MTIETATCQGCLDSKGCAHKALCQLGDPNYPQYSVSYAADEKPSNPKDAVGVKKVPFSAVPCGVHAEVALALMEGACKYGRHNYRVIGVKSSVYYDAALRHLMAWWEGESLDSDSPIGLSHITKAIASLYVLRDAMMNDKLSDDRPPKLPDYWLGVANAGAADTLEHFKTRSLRRPYTEEEDGATAGKP